MAIGRTKSYYTGVTMDNNPMGISFIDDARARLNWILPKWCPGNIYIGEYAIKVNDPSAVFAFVYAGYTSVENERVDYTLLHPHARRSSSSYIMGERLGDSSGDAEDTAEGFAGIGLHVHELGHLFGIRSHGGGERTLWNPYARENQAQNGANAMFWCVMQSSGADGPMVPGRASNSRTTYLFEADTCPTLFNPFYMEQLGWDQAQEVTTVPQRIDPAPQDYYRIDGDNDLRYMFEFRRVDTFGRFAHWYEFERALGLLIWKDNPRDRQGRDGGHRLIPADHRPIRNALPASNGGASQRASTGRIDEYSAIEETVSPEVLDQVRDWILTATGE